MGGGAADVSGFRVLLFNRLSPIFPVDTLAISSGLATAPRKRRRQAGSEASVLDADTGCREGACSLLPTSEHAH